MKKFTSAIVVLAMLVTMMTAIIPTASASWDGSSVSAGLLGTGTEYDPYLITSENDLAFLAKQVNDGTELYDDMFVKLTVDLDLGNKSWTPIGKIKGNTFRGTFDGDGHTIYNLTCKTEDGNSSAIFGGVFGRIDNGIVKNLNVEGAVVVSAKYAGAVVGQLTGTAGAGESAVINCHVINADIRGLQIGGLVGRSSLSGAAKGDLKIIGCTANNVTFNPLAENEFTQSIDFTNHFVGGIVGGAGATIINGCGTTNMTANIYGSGFAPAGGIVGVQGADKAAADVTNCYAINLNFTARADSHATKTQLGGLIGKAAHISFLPGDPNGESKVFNCFVSGVNFKNEGTTVAVGCVIGLINDFIYFNDIYYVPSADLGAWGEDKLFLEPPFVKIASVAELTAENLNSGNSTAVWVEDAVVGHPIINLDAALANEPNYIDYYDENETTEATTEAPAPVDTTPIETDPIDTTPVETDPIDTTPVETDPATEAPAPATEAPAPATEAPKEGGCGGMIAGSAVVLALLGAAFVFKKRN